ncbi:hypothetical protein AB4571_18680 [Vibrio breoganii]|uniref:hypothetical protein n=1 Tax=Vibrio breoganii TaxID=553239 RepID=UPI001056675C|nr:hypothetical protein [Vibrio breoganii]
MKSKWCVMARTASERKREQRARDKALGVKEINIRVHAEDEKAVKAHAQALLEKRLNKLQG